MVMNDISSREKHERSIAKSFASLKRESLENPTRRAAPGTIARGNSNEDSKHMHNTINENGLQELPDELKTHHHWSVYNAVTKKPYLKNGELLRLPLREAEKLLSDGWGLTFDFKDTPFCYSDLDTYKKVADKELHRKLIELAQDLTYVEISGSGQGHHIVYRGDQYKNGKGIDNKGRNILYMTGDSIGLGTIGTLSKEFIAVSGFVPMGNPLGKKTRLDVDQQIRNITTGTNFNDSLCALSSHYASKGVSIDEATRKLVKFMDEVQDKDQRWRERKEHLPVVISTAYDKFGGSSTIETMWDLDELAFYITKIDTASCAPSGLSAWVDDVVETSDNNDSVAWDVIRKLIKKYMGINMGAVDIVAKQQKEAVEGESGDDRNHAELGLAFADSFDPNLTTHDLGLFYHYDKDTGLFGKEDVNATCLVIGGMFTGKMCKRYGDYSSIYKLASARYKKEFFFDKAEIGVPAKSHFYKFNDDGILTKCAYEPKFRQRFKLGVDPVKNGSCPMFMQYLEDSFNGVDKKPQIQLLQEIMGGLVTGTFHRIQKAVLLHGKGNNGKSVLLELLGSFFPPAMKCVVNPALMTNEYYLAQLAGTVVNIVGELSQTKDVGTTAFKDVVGCDKEQSARHPYGVPFDFFPRTGHIFASNHFPMTKDHTKGFYRKWIVLGFYNDVDDLSREKIPQLGKKITEAESPGVLGWALDGAVRLAANNFTLTKTGTHIDFMEKWQRQRDSVFSYLYDKDEVVLHDNARAERKSLYRGYRQYCISSGLRPIGKLNFYDRVSSRFPIATIHGVRFFTGVGRVEKSSFSS